MNEQEIRIQCALQMGWDGIFEKINELFGYTPESGHGPSSINPIPHYTTSCDAALELVEKLREEGWRCSLNNGLDGGWECEFIRPVQPDSPPEHVGFLAGEDVEVRYSPNDSLPMAICLGFLKVRGHTA